MPNVTAVAISRQFEQYRLTAYWDALALRWTIGWGHTGDDVGADSVWTQTQADADQVARMERVEEKVRSLITIALPSGAIGALISLADNAGIGIEIGSRLIAAINRRDWISAAHEFIDDDHVTGRGEVQGLLKRRLYEAFIFLSSIP